MKAGTLLVATLQPAASGSLEELAHGWQHPPSGLMPLIRHEGAALWVHRQLAALGIRENVEPTLRAWLRREVLATAGVNLRVDAAARAALAHLAEAGIPAIPLKGVARRILSSRWPLVDARGLSDVDLLLPPARVEAGWEQLREVGYQISPANEVGHDPGHHHLAGLVGPEQVSIELHRSPSPLLDPETAWERFIVSAERLVWSGLEVSVPSATELAWHGISHAVTDGVMGFRLRHWLDLVALVEGGAPVDWAVIERRVATEPVPNDLDLAPVPAGVVRQWLGGGASLLSAGRRQAVAGMGIAFDLEGLLNGRARLLTRPGDRSHFRQRMLVEWTRGQLGWGTDPVVGAALRQMKARFAGHVARAAGQVYVRVRPEAS